MNWFLSHRERRLWFMVVVLISTIYATVGLAQSLANELMDRGLLDDLFGFGFLVIISGIAIYGLHTRQRIAEVGLAIGIVAVYLIVVARILSPAERSHIIEYSVVALLIFEALRERSSQGQSVKYIPLVAIGITTLVGIVDECIQFFVPGRVFDLFDILFDFLAACMAVLTSVFLMWLKRRIWHPVDAQK